MNLTRLSACPPPQVDVHGEVSILQALAGCRAACQLHDFGVDPAADAMFLVLKDYRCSLRWGWGVEPLAAGSSLFLSAVRCWVLVGCRCGHTWAAELPCLDRKGCCTFEHGFCVRHCRRLACVQQADARPLSTHCHTTVSDPCATNFFPRRRQWRARQPASPAGQLRLYYAIFAEVVAAVGALLDRGVVHFDLKCDNCLLEPLPGALPAPLGVHGTLQGKRKRLPCRARTCAVSGLATGWATPWTLMGPGSHSDGALSQAPRSCSHVISALCTAASCSMPCPQRCPLCVALLLGRGERGRVLGALQRAPALPGRARRLWGEQGVQVGPRPLPQLLLCFTR